MVRLIEIDSGIALSQAKPLNTLGVISLTIPFRRLTLKQVRHL
jgi:hypothetical protein